MYPNAKVGGGGTPTPDWRAKLPDALKTKVPDGADGFIKDGDVIIFTKGGEAVDGGKFNPDGSKYDPTKSENANPEVRTPSGTTPAGNGNGNAGRTGNGNGGSSSLFNYGFSSGNTGDLTANFVNGNYNIDPNKFMGAAMGFNAMSSLAQMMPFGLGAVFANNSVGAALNGFMKSVSFNFDFSSLRTSATAGDDTVSGGREDDSDGAATPTAGGDKSVAELAKSRGYTPTDTNGVYKNNGKFYKYDDKSKEFVECKADGTALGSTEQPATSGQTSSTQTTGQSTGTEQSTPVDNSAPKKKPAQTSGNGYNVSRHSDKVFWKKSGGTTHYYIDQNGKKVEISGYNGKTYTLNGKTYDAKTGKEVKATTSTSHSQSTQTSQGTKKKGPSDAWLKANGYTKAGDFYRKNGKFYAYHPGTNRMLETREMFSGGYYRSGPATMDQAGHVMGRHTTGATAGTYNTSSSSVSTPGHNYGNGNAIVKEATTRVGTDSDAQFQIGGGKYNLHQGDTTLDYYDITGQRSFGSNSHAFVNSDGSFNTNAKMFRDHNHPVTFEGKGEFDGCKLRPITDTNGYKCLCIEKNGTYYDFGTLMRTGKKVSVRPGTFISQG